MFEKKHELLRKLVREFAVNEIAPYAKEIDQTGHYPEELAKKSLSASFIASPFRKRTADAAATQDPMRS